VCGKGERRKLKRDKECFIFASLEGDGKENTSKRNVDIERKGIRGV
jgi:hypothetical protein